MRDPRSWDRFILTLLPPPMSPDKVAAFKACAEAAIDGDARALGTLSMIGLQLEAEAFINGVRERALARLRAAGEIRPVAAPDGAPNPLAAHFNALGGWLGVKARHGEDLADFLMGAVNAWDLYPGQREDAEAKFWAALRQAGAA